MEYVHITFLLTPRMRPCPPLPPPAYKLELCLKSAVEKSSTFVNLENEDLAQKMAVILTFENPFKKHYIPPLL